MKYKDYLEKSRILLEEAEKDLGYGCYNKAVSASWFAIETLLRAIILKLGRPLPERPNKLLSIIHRIIQRQHPNLKELIPILSSLYEKRKRADHKETIFSQNQARRSVNQAKKIYNNLTKIIFRNTS